MGVTYFGITRESPSRFARLRSVKLPVNRSIPSRETIILTKSSHRYSMPSTRIHGAINFRKSTAQSSTSVASSQLRQLYRNVMPGSGVFSFDIERVPPTLACHSVLVRALSLNTYLFQLAAGRR